MTDIVTQSAPSSNISLSGERPRYEPYQDTKIHPDAGLDIRDRATVTGSFEMEEYARMRALGDSYAYTNRFGVDADAQLFGGSSVMNCYLERDARLTTYDSVQVSGARIHGFVQVTGRAQIGERADLSSYRHFLSVGPIGSEARTVSGWRVLHFPGGDMAPFWSAIVRAGCFTGTIEQLAKRVDEPSEAWAYKDGPFAAWQADYRGFLDMMRERVAEWQLEAPDEDSVAFWTGHHPLAFLGVR